MSVIIENIWPQPDCFDLNVASSRPLDFMGMHIRLTHVLLKSTPPLILLNLFLVYPLRVF